MKQNVYIPWEGWEYVKIIGKGGFGTVYKIERIQHGITEKAAMKRISIPQSEEEIDNLRIAGYDDASITRRFSSFAEDIIREYGMMVQMRGNANIVYCDDYKIVPQNDGIGCDIYIKMELLTPLMKAMDQVSTEAQIVRFGMEMCNALDVCQKRHVIHRDVKPQNIFVSDDGVFKLGDFGIARTAERTTRATAGIGTYEYMAPEVKNDQLYGANVDIYSLGLVLYWLLNARRMPFLPLPPAIPTASDEEYARQRRFGGDKIPAPRDGSEELKRIVLKACAFNPIDRYQTAREMWADLNALSGVAADTVLPLSEESQNDDGGGATVGPVFKKAWPEQTVEETVGPNFKGAENVKPIDPNKTVGPVFDPVKKQQEPPKKKRKIWPLIAALAVCVILGGVLLLSRPSVSWKAPSGDILEDHLIDGYSAVGCYEVRTGIALSEKVNVEFKVGDAYNTMLVLITGKTLKTPVAVVVSDGVAAAKLNPNGTYLLQIAAED